jgi:pyridoxal phosphate enzyme (YggS family)
MEPADEITALAAARVEVLERMAYACSRAGRRAADVALVAVSKTVPADRLRLAQAAGHDRFGENRVQEAEAKISLLDAAEWHLVGHLQANKAGRAVQLFDVVEAVDSFALAARLDRLVAEHGTRVGTPTDRPTRERLAVYLQVNVDADPAKTGFDSNALAAELGPICELPRLEVRGLMTVGWLTTGGPQARPTFVKLRELSERLRRSDDRLGPGLSMGMSDDYEVAIEEGSTLVRVGRALFGARPPAG